MNSKTVRTAGKKKKRGGNSWTEAVSLARQEAGIEGFQAIRKGGDLYNRAKEIQAIRSGGFGCNTRQSQSQTQGHIEAPISPHYEDRYGGMEDPMTMYQMQQKTNQVYNPYGQNDNNWETSNIMNNNPRYAGYMNSHAAENIPNEPLTAGKKKKRKARRRTGGSTVETKEGGGDFDNTFNEPLTAGKKKKRKARRRTGGSEEKMGGFETSYALSEGEPLTGGRKYSRSRKSVSHRRRRTGGEEGVTKSKIAGKSSSPKGWALAVKKAYAALDLKEFQPMKKGTALYKKAKSFMHKKRD